VLPLYKHIANFVKQTIHFIKINAHQCTNMYKRADVLTLISITQNHNCSHINQNTILTINNQVRTVSLRYFLQIILTHTYQPTL
jgi:hypothetical protein